jgi:hypothetical protein
VDAWRAIAWLDENPEAEGTAWLSSITKSAADGVVAEEASA